VFAQKKAEVKKSNIQGKDSPEEVSESPERKSLWTSQGTGRRISWKIKEEWTRSGVPWGSEERGGKAKTGGLVKEVKGGRELHSEQKGTFLPSSGLSVADKGRNRAAGGLHLSSKKNWSKTRKKRDGKQTLLDSNGRGVQGENHRGEEIM